MTVLIRPDTITVERPTRTVDEHGWAEDGVLTPVGTLKGTVQQTAPEADARASEGGGEGPAAPSHGLRGDAYLSDAAEPGDVLTVTDSAGGSVSWRVASIRLVEDPRGGGHLNCWHAEVTQL